MLGSGEAIEALAPLSEHALLLASADGVLRAASLHPSRMLGEVGRHADPIEALAVDAQGALAATAAHDGIVPSTCSMTDETTKGNILCLLTHHPRKLCNACS